METEVFLLESEELLFQGAIFDKLICHDFFWTSLNNFLNCMKL